MTKRYKKWPRLNCDSSCPRLSKALPFWVLQVVQAIRKKTMHLKQKGPGIIEFNQQHWVPTGLFLRLNALWNRYIYIYVYTYVYRLKMLTGLNPWKSLGFFGFWNGRRKWNFFGKLPQQISRKFAPWELHGFMDSMKTIPLQLSLIDTTPICWYWYTKPLIFYSTWWFIPLSKWVITLVIKWDKWGQCPLITRLN